MACCKHYVDARRRALLIVTFQHTDSFHMFLSCALADNNTGIVGENSCNGRNGPDPDDETCTNISGRIGDNSCFDRRACKELSGEFFRGMIKHLAK